MSLALLILPGEIKDAMCHDENGLWTQRQLRRTPATMAGDNVLGSQIAAICTELNSFYKGLGKLKEDPRLKANGNFILEIMKNAHNHGTSPEDPLYTLATWAGPEGWALGIRDAHGFYGREDVKQRLEAGEKITGLPGVSPPGKKAMREGRTSYGYGMGYILKADIVRVDTGQEALFCMKTFENSYGHWL